MDSQRGRFISVEGVEGVGKSTIIKYVVELIKKQDIEVVLTREPGGTPLAESIRQVLLGDYREEMSADTELLLMFAGRAQNIQQTILPALSVGKWVVSDRFVDASFAYQGGGRGIDKLYIAYLANRILGNLQPDITLLLDAPVEVGLQRIQRRGAKDRIEKEGVDFFRRIRQCYLQLAKENANRFCIINANQSLDAVKKEVRQALTALRK